MTNNEQFDMQYTGVDTQMLSALLNELNIARRNARSYPKGHPVITASLEKVLAKYNLLMRSASEIVVGVARDMLIVEGISFDKANPIFRDFARVLFERGIATLVLRPGISLDELRNFIILLGLRREDIQKHGGIENIWLKARIATLSVRPIRYDLFTAREEDSIASQTNPASGKSLWEQFARQVVQHGGDNRFADENFDPELVAAILNGQHDQRLRTDGSADQVDTLADLMCRLDSAASDERVDESSYDKLGTLVSKLNPELRRQFLNSSFAADDTGGAARELVSHLSNDAVLDILEDVNEKAASVPPVIVGMLQRLAQQRETHHPAAGNDLPGSDDADVEKMRILFREHVTEEFTPDEYQQNLNRIMAADGLPRLRGETVNELLVTLEPRFVESRIGEIILQIAMSGADDADGGTSLARYLGDMCAYLLEIGDYGKLLDIMHQSFEPGMPAAFRVELRRYVSTREFMEEVLGGLNIWGKPKFEQIREIILQVGAPFVEVLLGQLAEEGSMSLRRFIMDRLIELGPAARDAVIDRLSDTRWYFLRNLLIILRSMNDGSILPKLRPLLAHDNLQVRQEVFKILVYFRDSGAEEQLLRDLDSPAPGVQMTAVSLAAACASPEILKRLVAMLNRSGFSAGECELKTAVVKALGEIGKVEVLPELAKILGASSLLNAKQLARLKEEVVRSLEQYPHQVVLPILQRLSRGSDDVARHAAAIMVKMGSRQA